MPRIIRVAGPAVLLFMAVAAAVGGLAIGGGADTLPVHDPGLIVRWGLPLTKLIVNLSAAGLIGALTLVCFAMSPGNKEYNTTVDVAAGSAALFTVAAAATGLFTFRDVIGSSILNPQLGATLSMFFSSIELGQSWLATALMGAAVTVLCFGVRNQTALIFVTALAVASLVPMAQQGHAAGTAGHDAAITGLGLHLVFAAVWLGGLLTIVLINQTVDRGRIVPLIERYSTLALISFLIVVMSGYVSAELRVGTFERLFSTDYGILVIVKILALVALGIFGCVYRSFLIERMRSTQSATARYFWWFIAAELAFMGIAFGTAAALARTPTPIPQELPVAPTPAQLLTGEPLPPFPEIWRYVTEWNADLLWLLVCIFGVFFYLAGVQRLRRRGDAWPPYRAVLWILGMLTLFYVTSGGASAYGKYLFSAHMVEHMALTMMVPVLLVPGAPITLALRAIRKRTDGSRGGREWILCAVHSTFGRIISNPIVAAILFVGSLWVFYYSPLFRWAVADHIGHEWMVAHFLIIGYLFVQSLIGIDPVPYRLPYPFRLLLLLGTMAFHAFFGLTLMTGSGLLLADWYGAMGWGTNALTDQQLGGGIAWSLGEIPTLVLAIVVAIQWARNDTKESQRHDRNADRTGETELNAYNARLARLAQHDNERT